LAQFGDDARPSRRSLLLNIAIALLGLGLLPFNFGASTYLVYSAAGAAFALTPRAAVRYMVVLSIAVVVASLSLPEEARYWMALPTILLIGTIGGSNVYHAERLRHQATLRRAREDVEGMAKIAERERIARDLHDLLGHTLSVITLKSELASKLADRDPVRAVAEIRDVERISRETLSEVRRAVEDYQHHGLKGELENAARALGTIGVRLETRIAALNLSPRQETVLALALREAVTNVVRHAGATQCTIRLEGDGRSVTLVVEDDGRGGAVVEGSGLAGMRARIAEGGGELLLDGARGMTLTVRLPAVSRRAVLAT
jgi:two-component system sensor histidine kinase DesK